MTDMNTNTTLSLDDMAAVNGGTFTDNAYQKWMYEQAGFICKFHFLAKDEFILNGVTYHEPEANKIMESLGWRHEQVTEHMFGEAYTHTVYYYNGEYVVSR